MKFSQFLNVDKSFYSGHRILSKLKNLIRHEMNQIGGQEMTLSAVGRKKIWEASDRWNLMHNELFKFKDHDEEYCLSPVRIFFSFVIRFLLSIRILDTRRSDYESRFIRL